MARDLSEPTLAAVLLCASGGSTPPRGRRLAALAAKVTAEQDFTATLSGARIEALGDRVTVGREPGELRRLGAREIAVSPGEPVVWDGRYEITVDTSGYAVTAALGQIGGLSRADRAIVKTVPAWARGALPVLIRDDGSAPILAWRRARVLALGPRRLALALGETTHEGDLDRTIHGEMPPSDLFSIKELHKGVPQGPSCERKPR